MSGRTPPVPVASLPTRCPECQCALTGVHASVPSGSPYLSRRQAEAVAWIAAPCGHRVEVIDGWRLVRWQQRHAYWD